MGGRERARARETERARERESERETKPGTETKTKTETDRATEGEKDRQTHTQSQRERERESTWYGLWHRVQQSAPPLEDTQVPGKVGLVRPGGAEVEQDGLTKGGGAAGPERGLGARRFVWIVYDCVCARVRAWVREMEREGGRERVCVCVCVLFCVCVCVRARARVCRSRRFVST